MDEKRPCHVDLLILAAFRENSLKFQCLRAISQYFGPHPFRIVRRLYRISDKHPVPQIFDVEPVKREENVPALKITVIARNATFYSIVKT
jgi:hypothetical protein